MIDWAKEYLEAGQSGQLLAKELLWRLGTAHFDLAEIQAAKDAGCDLNAIVDESEGLTLLMSAAKAGRPEVIKALIAAGVVVDALDSEGETALSNSVRYNHVEATKALVEAGADIFLRNDNGMSPLGLAIFFSQIHVLKKLVEDNPKVTLKKLENLPDCNGDITLYLDGIRLAIQQKTDERKSYVRNGLPLPHSITVKNNPLRKKRPHDRGIK